MVEYETKTGRVNKGVATNWLKNKLISDNGHKSTVPMFIRKSQFRLPFKATNPVLMVGPGTGIAPFMGFIQERGWLKEQGPSNAFVGIFGFLNTGLTGRTGYEHFYFVIFRKGGWRDGDVLWLQT